MAELSAQKELLCITHMHSIGIALIILLDKCFIAQLRDIEIETEKLS